MLKAEKYITQLDCCVYVFHLSMIDTCVSRKNNMHTNEGNFTCLSTLIKSNIKYTCVRDICSREVEFTYENRLGNGR